MNAAPLESVLGSDLRVGDVVRVWWPPGRDTIFSFSPYRGEYERDAAWGGVRTATFAQMRTVTVFPGESFDRFCAAKLSPWNAAAQALRDASAQIAALPGDTSIALMHMQEAAEALDDWYAPGELSEADVREWERDDLARYPLVAALEAAVKGT